MQASAAASTTYMQQQQDPAPFGFPHCFGRVAFQIRGSCCTLHSPAKDRQSCVQWLMLLVMQAYAAASTTYMQQQQDPAPFGFPHCFLWHTETGHLSHRCQIQAHRRLGAMQCGEPQSLQPNRRPAHQTGKYSPRVIERRLSPVPIHQQMQRKTSR